MIYFFKYLENQIRRNVFVLYKIMQTFFHLIDSHLPWDALYNGIILGFASLISSSMKVINSNRQTASWSYPLFCEKYFQFLLITLVLVSLYGHLITSISFLFTSLLFKHSHIFNLGTLSNAFSMPMKAK